MQNCTSAGGSPSAAAERRITDLHHLLLLAGPEHVGPGLNYSHSYQQTLLVASQRLMLGNPTNHLNISSSLKPVDPQFIQTGKTGDNEIIMMDFSVTLYIS